MRGHLQKHRDRWRGLVYVGVDEEGKEVRRSKVFHHDHSPKGRRAAEAELAEFVLELEAQRPVLSRTEAMTVEQLMARWCAARAPDWSPTTDGFNRDLIRLKITPRLGDVDIAKVRPMQLDALYAELLASGAEDGGPLAARTVRRCHTMIHAAFVQAVNWELVVSNPAAAATPPSIRRAEVNPPTVEAVTATLARLEDPMWRALFRMAVTTGARRSQLLGFRRSDLVDGRVTFERGVGWDPIRGVTGKSTKTDQPGRVTLDAATVAAVDELGVVQVSAAKGLGVRRDRDPWVFTDDPAGGEPMAPARVGAWWSWLRKTSGGDLDGVRFHDLRHFAATQMLTNGVDVATVAGRLGHKSSTVTLSVYSHFIEPADAAAADLMGDLLDG